MASPRRPLSSPSPRVQHVLTVVQQLDSGKHKPSGDWLEFHLDMEEFHDLRERISVDGFWIDKHHRDYFPSLERFAIRMPAKIHERVLILTLDEIRRQLHNLAEGPASDFVKDVVCDGSVDFYPAHPGDNLRKPDYGPHVPDGGFRHLDEPYASVILEPAYSQSRKMLPLLANDYILGSDMRIRVVVAFDISYRKKETALIVFRPRAKTVKDKQKWSVESKVEILRDENGQLNRDTTSGLTLNLQEFASVESCSRLGPMDGTIFISCDTLCQILLDAEKQVDRILPVPAETPGLIKEKFQPPPEEKLSRDDGKRLLEAEKRVQDRVDRGEDSSLEEI